jgi:hypothetical protein
MAQITPAAVAAPAKSVQVPVANPGPAPRPAPKAPAPAKPAPKAAPKPAPKVAAPAPDPKPNQDDVNSGWFKKEFAELDELDAQNVPRPAPGAKPKPKAVEEPETPEPETETVTDPEEATPPDERGVERPRPEKAPETNAELRKAFDRAQLRIKDELEPKLTKAEARVKELESREPEEVAPLREKLTAIEKRNQELESEIEYVNFSSSEKFKNEYAQPYLTAFQKALKSVQQLTVETPEGEERPATQEDLLFIANLPEGEAIKKAGAMFGDAASVILRHREKLVDLAEKQQEALESARSKSGERSKQRQKEESELLNQSRAMWKDTNQKLAEKYPTWFAPDEDDKEGNELLAKGRQLAARLFEPTDETRPKTPEEAVRLHSLIFNKAANHDRLALRLKKSSARIKELEEELKQFEASEPGSGRATTPGRGAVGVITDYESEIDELSRKGPQ